LNVIYACIAQTERYQPEVIHYGLLGDGPFLRYAITGH